MSKKYVIITDDGIGYEDVFLTFSNEEDGYTTVDYIDEVNEFDIHDTIADALDRAEDANSGTFGGWAYSMRIAEVLNFDAAVKGDEEPEFKVVRTLMFHR
jgi:hypothetical protein